MTVKCNHVTTHDAHVLRHVSLKHCWARRLGLLTLACFVFCVSKLRELVKTILHARDPLLWGGGKEETMGLEG